MSEPYIGAPRKRPPPPKVDVGQVTREKPQRRQRLDPAEDVGVERPAPRSPRDGGRTTASPPPQSRRATQTDTEES